MRPGGFFFITVSRRPRAVSSSLSSCKGKNSRDCHKKSSTGKKIRLLNLTSNNRNKQVIATPFSNQNSPSSAVSLSEPPFPAVHALAPSACSSAVPHPLFPSSSLSPAIESHGHHYLAATDTDPSISQRSKLEMGFFAIYF